MQHQDEETDMVVKRLHHMLETIREDLQIDKKYELKTSLIKQKIEKETSLQGYWDFKKQIPVDNKAIILIKWQQKHKKPVTKKLVKCPFCRKDSKIWEHYMICDRMPEKVLQLQNSFTLLLHNLSIEMRVDQIMRDINLQKLQTELRTKGHQVISIRGRLKS